jgi:hypothetical protein
LSDNTLLQSTFHLDDALRAAANDSSRLQFCDTRSATTAHNATNEPSHDVPLPLNMSSPVELPVEFDAAAKFARNKTATQAAAKGPSDVEALPLIISSSPVELLELPVEFDAEATFARSKTATHAAARGPSDIEALPLIMSSPVELSVALSVELSVELDAAAMSIKPWTTKAVNKQIWQQVLEDIVPETIQRFLRGIG